VSDRIATRRLWLTADGAIVEEGDPAAVSLLAGEGCVIPDGYDEPPAPGKHVPKAVDPEPAPKAVDPDPVPETKSGRRK
jgi:hypothetical protein